MWTKKFAATLGRVCRTAVVVCATSRSCNAPPNASAKRQPELAPISGQLGDLQNSLRRLEGRLAALDRSLIDPLGARWNDRCAGLPPPPDRSPPA